MLTFLSIIGWIFLYSLIGCVTSAIYFKIHNLHYPKMNSVDQEFLTMLIWVFWPVALVFLLFVKIPYLYIYKKIVK